MLSLAGSLKQLTILSELSCFLTWKFLKNSNDRRMILAILVGELARRNLWDLEQKFRIELMPRLR